MRRTCCNFRKKLENRRGTITLIWNNSQAGKRHSDIFQAQYPKYHKPISAILEKNLFPEN